MDILAIQRSLAILEDRYREFREIGEKHRQAWRAEVTALREVIEDVKDEKEGLESELKVVRDEKEGLVNDLSEAREEAELCLLQLQQAQEELEHYFLEANQLKSKLDILDTECKLKDKKLEWLRSQRQLLIDLVKYQFSVFGRFADLNLRFKWSKSPGRTRSTRRISWASRYSFFSLS